jgi:AbiV family abortive infection protein
MTDKEDKTKAAALEAVVVNVKRLLDDARLLQVSGSAGSALSISILAFEEAGKGHIIENGWQKPKQVSTHSYRHSIALFVLFSSLMQKFRFDLKGVNKKLEARFKAANTKPRSKEPLPPISPKLREELESEILPQLKNMSDEQIHIFRIEQRWILEVAEAVQQGGLEKIRQSGLYLDTDAQLAVTSTPASVERSDAERWIWATTRVLNLLEKGAYFQAYSPISELLTAAKAGDEKAARMIKEVRSTAVKEEE